MTKRNNDLFTPLVLTLLTPLSAMRIPTASNTWDVVAAWSQPAVPASLAIYYWWRYARGA